MIVNEDAAHGCLADLGKLGVVQFTDVGLVLIFTFLLNHTKLVLVILTWTVTISFILLVKPGAYSLPTSICIIR